MNALPSEAKRNVRKQAEEVRSLFGTPRSDRTASYGVHPSSHPYPNWTPISSTLSSPFQQKLSNLKRSRQGGSQWTPVWRILEAMAGRCTCSRCGDPTFQNLRPHWRDGEAEAVGWLCHRCLKDFVACGGFQVGTGCYIYHLTQLTKRVGVPTKAGRRGRNSLNLCPECAGKLGYMDYCGSCSKQLICLLNPDDLWLDGPCRPDEGGA